MELGVAFQPGAAVPHARQQSTQRGLVRQRCSPGDESSSQPTTSAAADAVAPAGPSDSTALPDNFCIIESRESVRDFAKLQLDEINKNIEARRNKIFLLMEEVRRLRIQQRLKGGEKTAEEEVGEERYPSVVPFLPPLTDATIREYFRFYIASVGTLVLFGGLLAPMLEVRLGLGGTTYGEFIRSLHLPQQLAQVDPIVASFCGGAVGVLSTLMVVEANNAKAQAERRCVYCGGTGYIICGSCKKVAREHDIRLDPFY
ncbi:hypothetical protein WJX81_003719 [Elliptochloris bilobata]|uniref:Uncharacterized protein n=1 Tax=Elliptochloris bilobata TaxID=381761 RepID=A0AAW1QII1_9CHLO